MIEIIGGRKFIGFMTLLVMGFVLVLADKFAVEAFMTFATTGLAIYTTGNVVKSLGEI